LQSSTLNDLGGTRFQHGIKIVEVNAAFIIIFTFIFIPILLWLFHNLRFWLNNATSHDLGSTRFQHGVKVIKVNAAIIAAIILFTISILKLLFKFLNFLLFACHPFLFF